MDPEDLKFSIVIVKYCKRKNDGRCCCCYYCRYLLWVNHNWLIITCVYLSNKRQHKQNILLFLFWYCVFRYSFYDIDYEISFHGRYIMFSYGYSRSVFDFGVLDCLKHQRRVVLIIIQMTPLDIRCLRWWWY